MGRFTVISNKTLSSKLEYLHFSFAAWPENQENALTHTHTLVRVHTKHSELKGFKKVEIMSGYPFIHTICCLEIVVKRS